MQKLTLGLFFILPNEFEFEFEGTWVKDWFLGELKHRKKKKKMKKKKKERFEGTAVRLNRNVLPLPTYGTIISFLAPKTNL